ncbi:DUF481 domain-containing protein [bacterium]|nr:DUF481 domain-containing protein [bacterium]
MLGLSASLMADEYPDRVVLKNGDELRCEVKNLTKGILTLETDYSDSDFKIEWDKVRGINSSTMFSLTLKDGSRIQASLNSTAEDSVNLLDQNGQLRRVHLDMVVGMQKIQSGFWERLKASVDLGFSYAKNNNLSQYNARVNLGYRAEMWFTEVTYSEVRSSQDNVENVFRSESKINYVYLLPSDWYATSQINFLSNTEQSLDLRSTLKLGLGKFIIHTNQMYWGLGAGLAYNQEQFAGSELNDRSSSEAYLGSDLNLFDTGDLTLHATATLYPSLTESERVRFDGSLDLKYDLPLDFYIGLGFSINYDNQPAVVDGVRGAETDYVTQLNFGWEL